MKFVRDYAFGEKCSMGLGFMFLLGANLAELGVPLYIGAVIDMFAKRDFEGVSHLSAWMLLCIIVSSAVFTNSEFMLSKHPFYSHRFRGFA